MDASGVGYCTWKRTPPGITPAFRSAVKVS